MKATIKRIFGPNSKMRYEVYFNGETYHFGYELQEEDTNKVISNIRNNIFTRTGDWGTIPEIDVNLADEEIEAIRELCPMITEKCQ